MNKGRRFLPPASCTGGLRVNGRLMVYSTSELPEDLALRLRCLKEVTGLSWNQLCDVLGVDSKQIRRWRKGIEPCGGAIMAIFWVASQVPGGLDMSDRGRVCVPPHRGLNSYHASAGTTEGLPMFSPRSFRTASVASRTPRGYRGAR